MEELTVPEAKWQQTNGTKKCENGRPTKRSETDSPKNVKTSEESAKTVENK